jgi:uncharacterized membrane protein
MRRQATETEPAQAILKAQYEIMEKRLYNIITTPGMIVTVAIGDRFNLHRTRNFKIGMVTY